MSKWFVVRDHWGERLYLTNTNEGSLACKSVMLKTPKVLMKISLTTSLGAFQECMLRIIIFFAIGASISMHKSVGKRSFLAVVSSVPGYGIAEKSTYSGSETGKCCHQISTRPGKRNANNYPRVGSIENLPITKTETWRRLCEYNKQNEPLYPKQEILWFSAFFNEGSKLNS